MNCFIQQIITETYFSSYKSTKGYLWKSLASLSSACLCHHKINHQHKYELATESKYWLHTITNNPAKTTTT
jgi:hypothetical protein